MAGPLSASKIDRPRPLRLLFALLALSLIAAACGGDDDDDGSGGGDSAEVDENGVLHLPASLIPNSNLSSFGDISKTPQVPTDVHMLIYDTLLRAQMDGSYEPGLATKAEVKSPTVI